MGLLDIMGDGIHDRDEEEWGQGRALMHADRDREVLRDACRGSHVGGCPSVDQLDSLNIFLVDVVLSQCPPDDFVRHSVEGLL